ncbi:MAG: hypothetical protein WCD49_05400 [Candidatus Acidiferrales bacterium]
MAVSHPRVRFVALGLNVAPGPSARHLAATLASQRALTTGHHDSQLFASDFPAGI